MVNTVHKNFEGYTKHDLEKAKEARRLQGMVGNPTERKIVGIVREKLIASCPITVHHVDNANRIFDLTLPTSGERQRGQNQNTLESITSRSLRILSNCIST